MAWLASLAFERDRLNAVESALTPAASPSLFSHETNDPVPPDTATMPFAWTDTIEKQMLLRILQLSAPKLPDMNEVVAGMPEGVTAEACRHRMRKIKKEIASIEVRSGSSATAKGSIKRAAPTNAGGASTGKHRSKSAVASDKGEPAEEDDEEESCAKKIKHPPIKEEEDDDQWLI